MNMAYPVPQNKERRLVREFLKAPEYNYVLPVDDVAHTPAIKGDTPSDFAGFEVMSIAFNDLQKTSANVKKVEKLRSFLARATGDEFPHIEEKGDQIKALNVVCSKKDEAEFSQVIKDKMNMSGATTEECLASLGVDL